MTGSLNKMNNNNKNNKRKSKKTSGRSRNGTNNPKGNSIRNGIIPVHTFQRTSQVGVQIATTGFVPSVGTVNFPNFSIWYTPQSAFIYGNASNYIIANMPGYTDIAALFDEVMIESVEMSVYATNLEATTNTGSALLLLTTDYNDKNAPTSQGDVLQYQDCKPVPLLSQFPYKEKQTPKLLSYTLDSAGVSQASMPIRGFFRSNLDVDHYCRKGCFLQTPTAVQQYTFVFRYTYKCRIVK